MTVWQVAQWVSTPVVEAYLYGNLLLIDEYSLDLITTISFFSTIALLAMYKGLLASAVDPIAARVQGIPVRTHQPGLQHHHGGRRREHGQNHWCAVSDGYFGLAGCNCSTGRKEFALACFGLRRLEFYLSFLEFIFLQNLEQEAARWCAGRCLGVRCRLVFKTLLQDVLLVKGKRQLKLFLLSISNHMTIGKSLQPCFEDLQMVASERKFSLQHALNGPKPRIGSVVARCWRWSSLTVIS